MKTHGKWYFDKEIMDQETLEELKRRTQVQSNKSCSQSFWMCMPSMGEPLANAFQCPLFLFSSTSSQTFIPHFCTPNNNHPIFIAYSNSHLILSFRTQRSSSFSFPYSFEELEAIGLSRSFKVGGKIC